jgi:hypothetical protein
VGPLCRLFCVSLTGHSLRVAWSVLPLPPVGGRERGGPSQSTRMSVDERGPAGVGFGVYGR